MIRAVLLLLLLAGCSAPKDDWGAIAGGVKQVQRCPSC